MRTAKIRSTVVALIAVSGLTFASAPLTQVASADKNNHGYQNTVGKRNRPWHNTCANAQISFENALTVTENLAREGDTKGAEETLNLASKIYENATASGCHIGIVKVPPGHTVGPVVERPAVIAQGLA